LCHTAVVKSLLCSAATGDIGRKYPVLWLHNWNEPNTTSVYTGMVYDNWVGVEQYRFFQISNYAAVNGTSRGTTYEGIYFNRSKSKTPNIDDGSSNTLAFGEVSGTRWANQDNGNPGDYINHWMGVGDLYVMRGLSDKGQRAAVRQFSSGHSSIVQFCMGDGSARTLNVGIDQTTLRMMAGAHDGGVVSNY
jgi:hypothetical protein